MRSTLILRHGSSMVIVGKKAILLSTWLTKSSGKVCHGDQSNYNDENDTNDFCIHPLVNSGRVCPVIIERARAFVFIRVVNDSIFSFHGLKNLACSLVIVSVVLRENVGVPVIVVLFIFFNFIILLVFFAVVIAVLDRKSIVLEHLLTKIVSITNFLLLFFVLILVLLLGVVLVILGLAFLGTRSLQYIGAVRSGDAAQARALAEAGMEDARVKLDKDPDFPPAAGDEQPEFAWSEELLDADGQPVGYYEVEVRSTHAVYPYSVLEITSVGRVGPRASPVSQHAIVAELDISPMDHGDQALPNPELFRFHRWTSSLSP